MENNDLYKQIEQHLREKEEAKIREKEAEEEAAYNRYLEKEMKEALKRGQEDPINPNKDFLPDMETIEDEEKISK